MAVWELQRAAMAPSKWKRRVKNTKKDPAIPVPANTITNEEAEAIAESHLRYLTPGGRFLFAVCLPFLYLFDLGNPCQPPLMPPLCVARTPLHLEGEMSTEIDSLDVVKADGVTLRGGVIVGIGGRKM